MFGDGEAGATRKHVGKHRTLVPLRPSKPRAEGGGLGTPAGRRRARPVAGRPIMESSRLARRFLVSATLGIIGRAIWSQLGIGRSRTGVEPGHTSVGAGVPVGPLFRATQVWLLMAMYGARSGARVLSDLVSDLLMFGRGLSEQEVGIYAARVVLGVLGNLAGGHLERTNGTAFGMGRAVRWSARPPDYRVPYQCFCPDARGQGGLDPFCCRSAWRMECMLPSAWGPICPNSERARRRRHRRMNSAARRWLALFESTVRLPRRRPGSYDAPTVP